MNAKTNKLDIQRSKLKDPYISRLVFMLIAAFCAFAIIKPGTLFRLQTIKSMIVQFPEYGLMALGVMLCMITGGNDLSTVGIANLSAFSAAKVIMNLVSTGANVVVAIFCGLMAAFLVGAIAGLFNGFLVSIVRIPPILATLGSYQLYYGLTIRLTKGSSVTGLPVEYSGFMSGSIFQVIPMQLVFFVVAVIVIAFFLNYTSYGKKIYMLGTNQKAARFSGLKTVSLLMKTYTFSGILSSLGGLIMMTNYNSVKADYGSTYTLQTILIVVLGGVDPNGGRGKISGVVLTIVLLQLLSTGLNMFPKISNFYRPLIWGAVLLIVMVMNFYIENKKRVPSKQNGAIGN